VPKYLIEVTYTADGAKGLMKDGGSRRRQAAEAAIASAGAKMEAFYFAFGDVDAYVICDAPDHAAMSAASLTINASGSVRLKTIVLLTPEEMDQAVKKTVTYRAPGS
jgi:uncharacterized protein with GYD domain